MTSNSPTSLPVCSGMDYRDFLPALCLKRRVKRYLEIGVSTGLLLSKMPVEWAVGVDPEFVISNNVAYGKQKLHLYNMTSDEFFADEANFAGFIPQLSFLDGYHTFDYLIRDFIAAERISNNSSIICLHDCMPSDDIMTIRHLAEWREKTNQSRFPNAWTGDVWKIVPVLLKYRPDLRIHLVDAQPTGLVFISNLDNKSQILKEKYWNIVDETLSIGNTETEIAKMYDSIRITSTADILFENDQSLYFNN